MKSQLMGYNWVSDQTWHYPAYRGDIEVCKLILEHYPRPLLEDGEEKKRKRYGKWKHLTDDKGQTPLHLAAMTGEFEVCVMLLEKFKKHPKNSERVTPHCLAQKWKHPHVAALFENPKKRRKREREKERKKERDQERRSEIEKEQMSPEIDTILPDP